jgi:hypothetical protein
MSEEIIYDISQKQIDALNAVFGKLKTNMFGYNSKFSIIPLQLDKTSTYADILEIHVKLTGQQNVPIVSSGIIHRDIMCFLEKYAGFAFPPNHIINKRPHAFDLYVNINGKDYRKFGPKSVVVSKNFDNTLKDFFEKNYMGQLSVMGMGYFVNYKNVRLHYLDADRSDLFVNFVADSVSISFKNLNGQNSEITDEEWETVSKELGIEIDLTLIKIAQTSPLGDTVLMAFIESHSKIYRKFKKDM